MTNESTTIPKLKMLGKDTRTVLNYTPNKFNRGKSCKTFTFWSPK